MKTEKRNIILTGFSYSGKTVVGKEVARQLGWKFVDADEEIVKLAGKSIPQIFSQDGEEHFRELEREILKSVCSGKEVVISAGGGAILDAANRKLMAESGMVICLEARPETIYQRLLEDNESATGPLRPLLNVEQPLRRIEQLKAFRQPYYVLADWTIPTDELTVEQVCQEVIRGWNYGATSMVTTATESYPIFVGWGSLPELGERMRQVGLKGKANIISDEVVFPLYGQRVRKCLEEADFVVDFFTLPPGESTKTLENASRIYDFLVERRTERDDIIVALGGGVVGDLAGFVASTFLRGISLVQVPTTLIAMSDASIGGKTAVNHPQGKNLIGTFYQPRLVLADVQTLTTLPQRELTSGWSEVIKHSLILSPELFQFLEDNADKLLRLDTEATTEAIRRSVAIKAKVVSEDEKEQGKRTILNYGHTIAHGLEAATHYQRLSHGEAVAIGMMGAGMLSHRMGLSPGEVVEQSKELLTRFGLPTNCPQVNLVDVLRAMELDKKVREKAVRWVLLTDIGQVVIRQNVPHDLIVEVLKDLLVD